MTANANGFNAPEPFYNDYGNPDQSPNSLSPRLLPTYDPTVSFPDPLNQGQPTAGFLPTANFLAQFPRLAAQGTVEFTGSETDGDTCFISIYSGLFVGGLLQVSTMALSGDTLGDIAERLLNLLNVNATLKMFGISAALAAPGGNPTITLSWPGPVGNFAAVQGWSYANTETLTVGGTQTDTDVLTVTLASAALPKNSAQLFVGGTKKTGDVVSAIFESRALATGKHKVNYTVLIGDTLTDIAAGLEAAIAGDSALDPLGLTLNTNGVNVWLVWSNVIGPVFVSTSVSRAATETITLVANGGAQPSALAPSAPQTETVTIGGTVTTGDVLNLLLYAATFRPQVQITYTTQGGDTTSTIAAAIAALINANTTLAAGAVTAEAVGPVITITWSPLVSGLITFDKTVAGVATETLGFLVAPTSVSVQYTTSGSEALSAIATALSDAINANAILSDAGVVASPSSDVVTIDTPGSLAPVTFTDSLSGGATETLTFANTSTAETLTIAGSDTAGDKLTLKVANPGLSGGSASVTYTVLNTDDATAIATAIAGLINASGAFKSMGFVATHSLGVVTMRWSGNAGPMTFTTSHSGGATETLTLGGSFHGTETFTMGQFAGGDGPTIPLNTAEYSPVSSTPGLEGVGTTITLVKGVPVLLDFANLETLITSGAAIM